MRNRKRWIPKWVNVPSLAVISMLIGSWQVADAVGIIGLTYVPPPSAILSTAGDLLRSGELGKAVSHTLVLTVVSSALAIVFGGVAGVIFAVSKVLRAWTEASVDLVRTVPAVALMPVALLLWGSSATSEAIVATFAGFWIMLVSTAGGVLNVNARLHDVGAVFQLGRAGSVRKIVAPAATAAMLVGTRLTVVTCLVVCIVAEMLLSYQGLGYALVRAQNSLQPEQMWAYALSCGVLGYLLNVLLIWGSRRAFPGMRELRREAS